MPKWFPLLAAACAALLLWTAAAPSAPAGEDEDGPAWHANLEKGLDAAKKSGKPVFVVTIWKTGFCNSCDTWRSRVPKDEGVAKALSRFEPVEWLYDNLNGKVIQWTLANGGKSTDPAAQLFVVGTDGKVVSRLEDAKSTTPASVAEWLKAQADQWEKDHPRTALAFARAEVVVEGEGKDAKARCAALDAARAENKPVLLYFGRDAADSDKPRAAEAAAARKFEKGPLDSKAAAEAAAESKNGWTLLRFDLAEPSHAALAKSLGVEKAPALLLWEPVAAEPTKLPPAITGPDLAFKLKKAGAAPPK
jgi:hypothetical protein